MNCRRANNILGRCNLLVHVAVHHSAKFAAVDEQNLAAPSTAPRQEPRGARQVVLNPLMRLWVIIPHPTSQVILPAVSTDCSPNVKTPLANRLIRHNDTPFGEDVFDISDAHGESGGASASYAERGTRPHAKSH